MRYISNEKLNNFEKFMCILNFFNTINWAKNKQKKKYKFLKFYINYEDQILM